MFHGLKTHSFIVSQFCGPRSLSTIPSWVLCYRSHMVGAGLGSYVETPGQILRVSPFELLGEFSSLWIRTEVPSPCWLSARAWSLLAADAQLPFHCFHVAPLQQWWVKSLSHHQGLWLLLLHLSQASQRKFPTFMGSCDWIRLSE